MKSGFCTKIIGWIFAVIKRRALTFLTGFVFAILCFVSINVAMEPVSTSEYCGTNCHEMDTAYQSWKLSVHAQSIRGLRVGCIDCHLPSKDNFFTHIAAKAYTGAKDMFKHHFGGEYDLEKVREKVLGHITNEPCLRCHAELLANPSSEIAKEAHMESLNSREVSENRCIECHEDIGHLR